MTSYKNSVLFIFLVAVFFSATAQSEKNRIEQITSSITYLASRELEGRKAGTDGDSLAAVYIRSKLVENGAGLMLKNGFQYFGVIAGVKSGVGNKLSINGHDYQPGVDFQPFSFSANSSLNAPVVFAGFGLSGSSGELEWF